MSESQEDGSNPALDGDPTTRDHGKSVVKCVKVKKKKNKSVTKDPQ